MGASEPVQREGAAYLRLLMLGLVPMNVGVLVTSVFKARGNTFAKLVPTAAECAVWLAGSLALGHGAGMGLAGLALAFVLGKCVGAALAWRVFRASALGRACTGSWRPEPACMVKMLRVGVPTGVQNVLRNLSRMAIYAILALMALPADAMAAYAIGFRLESLVYLPLMALGIACATLVGQHLGAGSPERAAAVGRNLALAAAVAAGLVGVALWFGAEAVALTFTTDPLVWAWTVDLLRALAAGLPFLAVGVVLSGALQGAGDTGPPMLFTLGSQLGFGIPLAYWLSWSCNWGPAGVWWAITGGMAVNAVLMAAWYAGGHWTARRI
jgi:putative MATE family efflux protein